MTPRMIYLTGQPGAGKSVLMAKLTEQWIRHSIGAAPDYPVPHDVLVDKVTCAVIGAELGVRRPLFSGTDALASSIIERAIPWVKTVPYPLLLAEGARLSNRRFIYGALDAGYHVTLALLDHPDADTWRKRRAREIGREQDSAWVKGRLSASRNLADLFDKIGQLEQVTVLRGHPDELEPMLGAVLLDSVNVR